MTSALYFFPPFLTLRLSLRGLSFSWALAARPLLPKSSRGRPPRPPPKPMTVVSAVVVWKRTPEMVVHHFEMVPAFWEFVCRSEGWAILVAMGLTAAVELPSSAVRPRGHLPRSAPPSPWISPAARPPAPAFRRGARLYRGRSTYRSTAPAEEMPC